MTRTGKWILGAALLAAPAIVAAQAAPPTPPVPPAGPEGAPYARAWGRGGDGPGMRWGNRFGPGQGFHGEGFRGQGRGFARRGPGHMGRGMRGFGPGEMGMRGRRGLGRMLRDPQMRERLGVTPEQAAKIQQQESAFAQSGIRGRADLQARQLELRGLMEAENPDRALIDRKMKELSDARLASERAQFEHQLAMRNALTPEQKQKLNAWQNELRQNMRQRRPGFGPGGPDGPGGFRRPQPPPPPARPDAPKPPDQPL